MRYVAVAAFWAASSVQAAPPPVHLLPELKSLCVDTGVRPSQIGRTALARGYRQTAPGEFQVGEGARSVVVHIERSNIIEIDGLGPIQGVGCSVSVRPAGPKDVDEVFRWLHLGPPPLKDHYSFMLLQAPSGMIEVVKGNIYRQQQALDAGMLRMLLVERTRSGLRAQYIFPKAVPED